MTEAQDARHQAAKRMRRIARILGLFWACCWWLTMAVVLLSMWAWSQFDYPTPVPPESCLGAALLLSSPWVVIAISWRWEAIGGVLFALQSLIVFILAAWLSLDLGVNWGSVAVLLVGAWPLALGILFLASWWRSGRPETPLQRIVLGGLLGGLILLVFGASIADRLRQAELERQAVDATATALGDYMARSENMELVGHVGGNFFGLASDLLVQGEYAYIVGGVTGFHVVDVSNRGEPVKVGSYAMSGRLDFLSVYVSGSYAYVAADPDGRVRPMDVSSSLRVLDVSNPASPFEVGSYAMPGRLDYHNIYESASYGVYVSGSYAYVAADTLGMRVVDVSNPASPYEVSFYDTPGRAFDVYVSGSYAYVADWDGGLRVLDVSSPASPFEVGSCATPDTAGSVFVSGSHAYVTTGSSGLRVIDVSKPGAPVEVGRFAGPAMRVCVSGPYAYLAAGRQGLFILRMVKD